MGLIHYAIITRIIGMLLMMFSMGMLIPAFVSILYSDGLLRTFIFSFAYIFLFGMMLVFASRNQRGDINIRDGFLVVALFWFVLGVFGAIPFMLAPQARMGVEDALFESISGLTTTGATVMVGLDNMPESLLFYRQMLQWLGGIGIIVIAVAVLPILGIGGMQMYRAETPGPIKDSKLTPRITSTAKVLFSMYLAITVCCALAYWIAGMTLFDAICHAFSTVAIGGFSTHDASLGYFDSSAILMVSSTFMVLAGINFAVHFTVFRSKRPVFYFVDSEARFYLYFLLGAAVVTILHLINTDTFGLSESLVEGIFNTVSMATTTGFTTSNFSTWPTFLPIMLIMLSFVGGCAGSTGGGIKVIRCLLIAKQGLREMRQLVHPNAVIPLKLGKRRVEAKVVSAVWSFLAMYMLSFITIMLSLLAVGDLDFLTSFSATAASLNNLGPGLGDVAQNYGDINAASKSILSFSMLLGRLELFTLLVLFTPDFWRQ